MVSKFVEEIIFASQTNIALHVSHLSTEPRGMLVCLQCQTWQGALELMLQFWVF